MKIRRSTLVLVGLVLVLAFVGSLEWAPFPPEAGPVRYSAPVQPMPESSRVASATTRNNPPPPREPPVAKMSALRQMEIAFKGKHSHATIKLRMDQAMRLYGLPRTEENYSRAGSVLVALRRKTGVSEMDILSLANY